MIEQATFPTLDPGRPGPGVETLEWPGRFSFFRRPVSNTQPYKAITLQQIYLDIQGERNKPQTLALRSMTDSAQIRAFKAKNFDYVTFSGIFSKRSEQSLVAHSGLITIDLDYLDDLPGHQKMLLNDPCLETQLLFVSPSGKGLKWIVSIDLEVFSHLQWFNSISRYLWSTYRVKADPSGKDISRACFIPHDPQVWINTEQMGN